MKKQTEPQKQTEKGKQIQTQTQTEPAILDSAQLGKQLLEEHTQKEIEQKRVSHKEQVTLAQRLMNITLDQPIEVPFTDEGGAFTIKCRRLKWGERNWLYELTQSDLKNVDQQEINKKFTSLLAYPTGVCLEPELDAEFWDEGNYSQALPAHILKYISQTETKEQKDAAYFRKN